MKAILPRSSRGREKRVADDEEPVVLVPVVVDPVQVQVALRSVLVEIRDVAVAIQVLPDGAVVSYSVPPVPPPIDAPMPHRGIQDPDVAEA